MVGLLEGKTSGTARMNWSSFPRGSALRMLLTGRTSQMKGILVRIGVDQSYGRWNAPVDLQDGDFVFVPIPEKSKMRPQLEGRYSEILPALQQFARARKLDVDMDLRFPSRILAHCMHLDPDFDWLTDLRRQRRPARFGDQTAPERRSSGFLCRAAASSEPPLLGLRACRVVRSGRGSACVGSTQGALARECAYAQTEDCAPGHYRSRETGPVRPAGAMYPHRGVS